jgi:putative phosphoesterase
MRLAVVSDIHGNLRALEAVLGDIAERSPDAFVNLGDCVTSPLWPRETFELLQTLAWPTVRGNHDRWVAGTSWAPSSPSIAFTREALDASHRAALGNLPETLTLPENVLAVHGTPDSDTEYLLEEKRDGRLALLNAAALGDRLGDTTASLVLCGHSHHQHVAADARGRLVLNPGSVGCPRYADNADRLVNEAGSPHARYAIVTKRGSGWSIELVVLEYDWSVVASQAIRNGRPDFAAAFST